MKVVICGTTPKKEECRKVQILVNGAVYSEFATGILDVVRIILKDGDTLETDSGTWIYENGSFFIEERGMEITVLAVTHLTK